MTESAQWADSVKKDEQKNYLLLCSIKHALVLTISEKISPHLKISADFKWILTPTLLLNF